MSSEKGKSPAELVGYAFNFSVFLVFLTAKLFGAIAWSWWWVTAPLWGGIVFVLALLVIAGAVMVTVDCLSKFRMRKLRKLKRGPGITMSSMNDVLRKTYGPRSGSPNV